MNEFASRSTLAKLIEAMVGKMEIVAHFPFGDCELTQFDAQASVP